MVPGHHKPMRLTLLTALTMVAFAGNSLLNRLAVGGGTMDPASFALIRVLAGAAVLGVILAFRRPAERPAITLGILPGVLGLSVYLAGFSLAYLALGAGVGALILFGTVQVTMFAGNALRGQSLRAAQLAGALIAFGGLLVLLWPTAATPFALGPVLAMIAAGIGWGVYSLAGSGAADPIARTALNFVLAAPVMFCIWWLTGMAPLGGPGLGFAILSGAVTSGLGYALWYAILPTLGTGRAAVAQLTVPLIAMMGGAVLLNETIGLRFAAACVLVLGGVALASLRWPGKTPQN
jgi:drug/metabolite transporter (DMT)-like permease